MPTWMRVSRFPLSLLVGCVVGTIGCSNSIRRPTTGVVSSSSVDPIRSADTPRAESTVVARTPGSGDTFVDRHPLLRKPRQYYDSTDSNKVVKTAAAAFIGVPSGIVGELRQIVVGVPRPATSY